MVVAISYWLYGRREKKRHHSAAVEWDPSVARQVFLEHRTKLLTAMAEEFKIMPKHFRGEVWGVVMERGLGEGRTTILEVLADGTTNLRYSSGVRIGMKSDHPLFNDLRTKYFSIAESLQSKSSSVSDYPLPLEGEVQFFLLTRHGARIYASSIESLKENSNELSQLYLAGCAIENEWHKTVSPT